MKHEEAVQYCCPKSLGSGKEINCMGMRCAAWRWAEPKWGAPDHRRGFCGLAGEPKYPLNPDNEKA